MEWWIWIVAGCILLAVEITVSGDFYVFFFGIGAIVTGILTAFGYAGPDWSQWLVFSVVSILTLVSLRQKLIQVISPSSKPIDTMVGEFGTALEEIALGKTGKFEYRGSTWTALNTGNGTLTKGERCKIESVNGLTLTVRGGE